MWLRTICIANFALATSVITSQAQTSLLLRCDQAANHVGNNATVCGILAEGSYRPDVRGEPTFLDCGARYPKQIFVWLIWGDRRGEYSPPPERLEGSCVCGYGAISEHKRKPQIVQPYPFYRARTENEKLKCR
jgi:hypothetical protein